MFGSKCFPYTWNTKNHKFDPKTILCIFVGYSDKHKGYKCFHPLSHKIFVSRHVVFDETVFPFKSSSTSSTSSHVHNIFDSWLPTTMSLGQDDNKHAITCIPLPVDNSPSVEPTQTPPIVTTLRDVETNFHDPSSENTYVFSLNVNH